MNKRVKVEYPVAKGEVKIMKVLPHVWDLCFEVYKILLGENSLKDNDPLEQQTKWFAEKYKGGVGIEEAYRIVRVNSLFHYAQVEDGYDFAQLACQKYGVKTKPDKKHQFNPKFLYDMCVYYTQQSAKRNPGGKWDTFIKEAREKYTDKKKAEQRIGDRSQLNASVFRALIQVMHERKMLPKNAYN